jgi:hypothetical protein
MVCKYGTHRRRLHCMSLNNHTANKRSYHVMSFRWPSKAFLESDTTVRFIHPQVNVFWPDI